MNTKLEATRKTGTDEVTVTLSLNNIKTIPQMKFASKQILKDDEVAVIFHFGIDGSLEYGSQNYSIKDTFKIPTTQKQDIRVFYWHDDAEDSLVLDCFENAFIDFGLNETNLPIGEISNFYKYCKPIMNPRQGGNGGVVGIK